ncbi:MAG: pirin family protein [Spirulina sp. SIO3F2]|nr:pirin family protein [Spirulina sp. SIO3F2]
MLTIRKSDERGKANFRWLNSHHTFSFGEYFDPNHMGFGALRVINEDRVIAGEGFATHSHRDMEIITYVLDGALEHKDSIGNGSVIKPGDVQRMSAGTGIAHSEYNHSRSEGVHFLQIWIIPERRGLPPSYEQIHFDRATDHNQLRLVGSCDGRDGSVVIHQDVNLYAASLTADAHLNHGIDPNRQVWLQLAKGALVLNGQALQAGDGIAIVGPENLELISAAADTELLLFDLAAT